MREPADPDAVVLFDGVCNVCDASVQFLLRHDATGRLHFASLQSAAGQRLLAEHGLSAQIAADERDGTMVLVVEGKAYTRSSAVLKTAHFLGFGWRALSLLGWLVPRFLRDAAYGFFVRHRYRWFGKKEQCMIPTPEQRSRFLPE